jgi:DNA polymerase-3 subunit delta
MILKSYVLEQNPEILKNYQATVIYGQNDGIKDDLKEEIKKKNRECEVITLFESDILKSEILYQTIANQSLFAEKKIIFIYNASDKIFSQISESLEKNNNDIQIYIFSGSLEKKSKLRGLFEKTKKLAICACYEDNERTLITYINKELNGFGGLSGEITNIIINNSNMNRKIIKDEIAKIKNFFLEKKINKKEILEILNIKINNGFEEIRDKSLIGEKFKTNKLLSETEILNEEVFFYLTNLSSRVIRLHEIMQMSKKNNSKYEQILEIIKPPIFWKDKPIVLQQLKKWSKKRLEDLIIMISKTEILMKKTTYLRNDIIIKNLIVSIANKASSISS